MGKNSGGAGRGGRRTAVVAAAPPAMAAASVAPTVGPPQTAGLLGESRFSELEMGLANTPYRVRNYGFETKDGDWVEMTVGATGNTATVAFNVNGSTLDAGLPQDVANAVSLRLMRHMREDARTRPNGFKYVAYAQEGDSKTNTRAIAYEAIGMSRPTYARAGNTQYAVVRNGKLQPDNDALRYEEGNSAFSLYNDAWRGVADRFKEQRNRQR